MAWDDNEPEDDFYDEDEEEFEDEFEDDNGNGPAIVRNVYGSEQDPFEMPELDCIPLNDFLKNYTYTSATSSGTKYFLEKDGNLVPIKDEKKKDVKVPLLFDEQNLVIEHEVKSVGKQKVRGVRRGCSPKAPNK